MNKYILFVAILFIASLHTYGQGEMDAFKLSRNDQMGTARGISMGGAFGALGAEVTGVAQNPAGIGVYRSSEIVATMDFMSNNIETNTEGFKSETSKFKFAFDNVAYMGYMPLSDNTFKSFNFGFSYNRLKNFDRNYSMKGSNLTRSLTDYIAVISNSYSNRELGIRDNYDPYNLDDTGGETLPWLGILGYNAGIINPVSNTEYESAWPAEDPNNYIVDNILDVSERGHIESYDFSMGTNISNILYLGLTFSITDVYYNLNTNYTEDFIPIQGRVTGYYLENWKETTGTGYQVSVGAILKPVDQLRLGVAYHSPTWYNLQDARNGYLDALLPDGGEPYGYAPDREEIAYTDYKLQTPGRWVLSAAGIFGTKAILSIDYEYSDYSKMNLKNDNGFEYPDNDYIKEDFKGASTLKSGIEYRVNPQFSIRAGYCWAQSPVEKDFKNGKREAMLALNSTMPHLTLEGDANTFSYGLGYKFTPDFYIDLAFSFKAQTDNLYAFSNIPEAGIESIPSKFKNNTYKGLLTLGYKF